MQIANFRRAAIVLGGIGLVAAIALGIAVQLRAQPPTAVELVAFRADGYQASPTAPLVLQGSDEIGEGATLTIVTPPILSTETLVIPPPSDPTAPAAVTTTDFQGATCATAFSQFLVTAENGMGHLGIEAFAVECVEPIGSATTGAGAGKRAFGTFKISKSADGVYAHVLGGTGNYSMVVDPDGSAIIHLQGNMLRRRK
jgi:hypothetical protein